ncbi:hybrid sensor histidine kinase/response regulator [Halotalea alkalilenta]|uniref:histidine kinase n=1 Tax=Halotalea alkalilenta TaxID=376489 RepID=A0A172YIU5_9GAMM|nr:hybrid sensor histidine kinase/response regulator [Halotalea alkalilenta]
MRRVTTLPYRTGRERTTTQQRIFRVRRNYNKWVANQTLEDFALRFTAKSARRWSAGRVAHTALGAISFLALEAIGGALTLNYGFTNAVAAIIVVSLAIFLLSLPVSYYASRYGVDIDLLTRGAGFGYLGSTLTSLIYATFTFIFFALEAAIMALALEVLFGIPLTWGYVISSLVVIPIVTHGITYISRFQIWTQPLWIVLQLAPFVFILMQDPASLGRWSDFDGLDNVGGGFDLLLFGAGATVMFALVAQIGEQVDFLRFLPEPTAGKRLHWWLAMLSGGPGWAIVGAIKALAGSFLAVLAFSHGLSRSQAQEPMHMYLVAFGHITSHPATLMAMAGIFVVLSQLKINVTNAYAGSIAWSNFFSRLTHSHPGRVVWLVFNVMIALVLMEIGIYRAFEAILGTYSMVAMAWIGSLVADLVINKPLGLSPKHIEFKRAYLYDLNPVGFGSMLLATAIALTARLGLWGEVPAALASFLALLTAFIAAPAIALYTRGRYYIARTPEPATATRGRPCCICEHHFDDEDMAFCPAYNSPICSLCCSLDARCNDACKQHAGFQQQLIDWLGMVLPQRALKHINSRIGHFISLLMLIILVIAGFFALVFYQLPATTPEVSELMATTLAKVFAILVIISGVVAWLFVLAHESRVVAQEESHRQTRMLTAEIKAHEKTDLALQKAKELAEAANQAKSRYLTGLSHELRSPLNAAFGYAQLLEHDPLIPEHRREAVAAIRRSTGHLSDLIEGLLEISKIEAGRLELYRNRVRVRSLIDELVAMFRLQAQGKGIGFEFHHQGSIPEWVTTDERRLRQILINLLSNAIKFTNRGKVTLSFRYRNQVAEFTVKDTGIGIAEEDMQRIFRPFERIRKPGVPAVNGTGLGLTITQLLTGIMGGDLQVSSQPGKGSEFRLSVMLSSFTQGTQPRASDRPIDGYSGERKTLLVIDDDPTHRGLISDMLTPLGFQVIEAPDGRCGLDLALNNPPDLVLMDVAMPQMDGWQTARLLRRQGYRAPLVMISASARENHAAALSQGLHDDYLIKPFKLGALLDTLARQLELGWIHRHERSAAPAGLALEEVQELNGDLRDELVALAEIGHLRGLRERLLQARQSGLIPAPLAMSLESAMNRFDFHELIRLLEPHQ